MKTIEIQVEGLCCTDCAGKVEKVLRTAAGVRDLKILTAAEKAVIPSALPLSRPSGLSPSARSGLSILAFCKKG